MNIVKRRTEGKEELKAEDDQELNQNLCLIPDYRQIYNVMMWMLNTLYIIQNCINCNYWNKHGIWVIWQTLTGTTRTQICHFYRHIFSPIYIRDTRITFQPGGHSTEINSHSRNVNRENWRWIQKRNKQEETGKKLTNTLSTFQYKIDRRPIERGVPYPRVTTLLEKNSKFFQYPRTYRKRRLRQFFLLQRKTPNCQRENWKNKIYCTEKRKVEWGGKIPLGYFSPFLYLDTLVTLLNATWNRRNRRRTKQKQKDKWDMWRRDERWGQGERKEMRESVRGKEKNNERYIEKRLKIGFPNDEKEFCAGRKKNTEKSRREKEKKVSPLSYVLKKKLKVLFPSLFILVSYTIFYPCSRKRTNLQKRSRKKYQQKLSVRRKVQNFSCRLRYRSMYDLIII
jgi:hypothetical protein